MRWPWQQDRPTPPLILVVNGSAQSVREMRSRAQTVLEKDVWLTQTERNLAVELIAALDELVHVCGEPTTWKCPRCGMSQVKNGLW